MISHQYFNIDSEEIFYICSHDLDQLQMIVYRMIDDQGNGNNFNSFIYFLLFVVLQLKPET